MQVRYKYHRIKIYHLTCLNFQVQGDRLDVNFLSMRCVQLLQKEGLETRLDQLKCYDFLEKCTIFVKNIKQLLLLLILLLSFTLSIFCKIVIYHI